MRNRVLSLVLLLSMPAVADTISISVHGNTFGYWNIGGSNAIQYISGVTPTPIIWALQLGFNPFSFSSFPIISLPSDYQVTSAVLLLDYQAFFSKPSNSGLGQGDIVSRCLDATKPCNPPVTQTIFSMTVTDACFFGVCGLNQPFNDLLALGFTRTELLGGAPIYFNSVVTQDIEFLDPGVNFLGGFNPTDTAALPFTATLEISYVPEPSVVSLLCVGIVSTALRRIRRTH